MPANACRRLPEAAGSTGSFLRAGAAVCPSSSLSGFPAHEGSQPPNLHKDRIRYIFPLPCMREEAWEQHVKVGRRCRQRFDRKRAIAKDVNVSVRALNSLYAGHECGPPVVDSPTPGQRSVLDHLVACNSGFAPSADQPSGYAAAQELLSVGK